MHIQIKIQLKTDKRILWTGGLLHRGQRDLAVFGRAPAAAEQSLYNLVGEIITIKITTHFQIHD